MAKETPRYGPKAAMEPIKSLEAIQKIKDLLRPSPRDFALFVVGINTAFRAGDLLSLTVGDVRFKNVGDGVGAHGAGVVEGKTGKRRVVTINAGAHAALCGLLETMPGAGVSDPLFQSLRGQKVHRGRALTVQALQRKVAGWCAAVGLAGTYGSHTLRKTWAYQQRMNGANVDLLQKALGHSSSQTTMAYACIQPEEMAALYANSI